jgi:hypothetical protein
MLNTELAKKIDAVAPLEAVEVPFKVAFVGETPKGLVTILPATARAQLMKI